MILFVSKQGPSLKATISSSIHALRTLAEPSSHEFSVGSAIRSTSPTALGGHVTGHWIIFTSCSCHQRIIPWVIRTLSDLLFDFLFSLDLTLAKSVLQELLCPTLLLGLLA